MSNRYEILQQVIAQFEHYEKTAATDTPLSIEAFGAYLNRHKKPRFEGQSHAPHTTAIDNNIGALIGIMYRYVKQYSKYALEDTPLSTVDEFTYMITLFVEGTMSKTAVIERNVQEKTTGSEILKRLTKRGFIVAADDPADRRSQLISLSDIGKMTMIQVMQKMGKVSKIATADLTLDEKQQLLSLLNKLDAFHRNVLENEKILDADIILNKYFFD